MNRRTILTGLLAAPFVICTPGLLMPVRRLSAEERDPTDINGIIAELPDGATWRANPTITYRAVGGVRIEDKKHVTVRLTGATVLMPAAHHAVSIDRCEYCSLIGGRFITASPPDP